ncbi:hypothetical protein O6H91_08G098500 [Diphasiastrum complanatum]|uniref:Uncharacterized protein n=1 Tax=Diphasiastrum complanatum TaxID=34168 RepID=A0ACC2D0E5_DIPCM|nr:hypothetical protein O6H91_08G098500 [Diphasiastrum complanatum]
MGCRTAVAVCGVSKDVASKQRDFKSCNLCPFSLISSADLKREEKDERCFLHQATRFSGRSSLTWASSPVEISEAEGFAQQSDICLLGHCSISHSEDTLCKASQKDQLITRIYPDQVGFDASHMHSVSSMPLKILENEGQRGSCDGDSTPSARSRSSSPCSSIGVCEESACTSNEALVGTEEEVQSPLRGPALGDLSSLEKSLPLRQDFYIDHS